MANNSVNAKMTNSKSPRIAIVHDWLVGGGAEKVVMELHNEYPDAPIYTSYCSDEWRKKLDGKVITGYLQNWPFSRIRKFLPLLRQWWFARLDLSKFDLVISSSGNGESKFIRLNNPLSTTHNLQTTKQTHVCYCHSPPHFYWRHYDSYLRSPGFKPKVIARIGLKILIKPLRKRDYDAAGKVDHFIANSTHIQSDIKKYYDRDSTVIHPPVDTTHFSHLPPSAVQLPQTRSGFVTLGRQVPHKRIDLIIAACNELQLSLTVIGNGPEHVKLKQMAGSTISFKTNITDDQMPELLAKSEAFIFASEEDFGISPVEAMATGTPVIAYRAGGALDYVKPGITGEFFDKQTVASLKQALESFNPRKYSPSDIKHHAKDFSVQNFHKSIQNFITTILK